MPMTRLSTRAARKIVSQMTQLRCLWSQRKSWSCHHRSVQVDSTHSPPPRQLLHRDQLPERIGDDRYHLWLALDPAAVFGVIADNTTEDDQPDAFSTSPTVPRASFETTRTASASSMPCHFYHYASELHQKNLQRISLEARHVVLFAL